MEYTTIKVSKETHKKLSDYKIHPRESYEDAIKRIIGELNPSKEGDASKTGQGGEGG